VPGGIVVELWGELLQVLHDDALHADEGRMVIFQKKICCEGSNFQHPIRMRKKCARE
jgi:hypothetical protein